MSAVARVGDTTSHGGTIISGGTLIVNGKQVARDGDMHSCPIHGHGVTSLTGTAKATNGGKHLARVGDTAGCGAVITQGSPNVSAG